MAGVSREEQKFDVILLALPHKLDIDVTAMPIQNQQPRRLSSIGKRACSFWQKYSFQPPEGNAVRCPAFGGSGN